MLRVRCIQWVEELVSELQHSFFSTHCMQRCTDMCFLPVVFRHVQPAVALGNACLTTQYSESMLHPFEIQHPTGAALVSYDCTDGECMLWF
jgi:hypothetical protein